MKVILAPSELAALVSEYIGRRFTLTDGAGINVSLRSEGNGPDGRVWAEADFDALQNNHPKPTTRLERRPGVAGDLNQPTIPVIPHAYDGQPTHETTIAPSLPPGLAEALVNPDLELSPEDQKEVDALNEWRRGAPAQ